MPIQAIYTVLKNRQLLRVSHDILVNNDLLGA
jgi:hypothetical protein